jgi:hypothetical protein
MNIGQPKRIIEIEPATLPVPGELVPDAEPSIAEPEPAVPDRTPAAPSEPTAP